MQIQNNDEFAGQVCTPVASTVAAADQHGDQIHSGARRHRGSFSLYRPSDDVTLASSLVAVSGIRCTELSSSPYKNSVISKRFRKSQPCPTAPNAWPALPILHCRRSAREPPPGAAGIAS